MNEPTNPPKPKKRVRLVHVVVQPVLMIDDGETLEEFHQEPIVVPGREWATYSSDRWEREIAAFEAQLNEEGSE